MKTMTQKKSNSYDQAKLKVMTDNLCNNIEALFDVLGIDEYKISDKMITTNCPIHDGDNDSALNLYYTGDSYRGNWKCRTHQCEETFKPSILGFIRGCLSNKRYKWSSKTDKICTFKETIAFAEDFLGNKLSDIKVSNNEKEKSNFVNTVRYLQASANTDSGNRISRDMIKKSLDIPSKYFIDRGFSGEVLSKYDVGDCINPSKPMHNRGVVPIYDQEYDYMVGCTGRAISDKCDNCGCYHSSEECPADDRKYLYSKWKHNLGFKSQNHLYNLWFAKKFIKKTNSVIIVESPGNVWRLEESGIHNSVAVFGSSMSDMQKMILDTTGAMTIFTIMDNDEAGKKASENIFKKCQRTYNVYNIDINYPDIASMTIEQVKNEIQPRLIDE